MQSFIKLPISRRYYYCASTFIFEILCILSHVALVVQSLAALLPHLFYSPPARCVPWGMASSPRTLTSFPAQSLRSRCSLDLVCCSPNFAWLASAQGDSPSVTLPDGPSWTTQSNTGSLIANNIFPLEHVSQFVIIFMFVFIWLIYASPTRIRGPREWTPHPHGSYRTSSTWNDAGHTVVIINICGVLSLQPVLWLVL